MPHRSHILPRSLRGFLITHTLPCRERPPIQALRGFASSQSCVRNLSPTMSSNPTSPYEHFFRYTSGRWLWDEVSQLRERMLVFNVQELQRIAAESVGAQSCVSITKLAEGGYNKVFRLVMDNGSVAIARIPNPNAGPAHKTTASEVATMDFVRFLYHEDRKDVLTNTVPLSRFEPYSTSPSLEFTLGMQQQIIQWRPSIS
jgi:hypothetical protein